MTADKRLGENQFALLVDHQSTRRKAALGSGSAPILHVAQKVQFGEMRASGVKRQARDLARVSEVGQTALSLGFNLSPWAGTLTRP